MGKDKKRSADEHKEESTLFYHELIGIIFIILSIAILGKLGTVGNFMLVFFKVLFGDWFWIVVLFLLFFGAYNLFRHKKFDFKNQRFIGFCFFCFGLLIFSQFPLHSYIEETGKEYFSETWNIYVGYISHQTDTLLGGGLIGSVFFYLIFYLFSTVGVVMIGILIMLFGISLVINVPIMEMFKNIGKRTKQISKFTGNFNRFFKYRLGTPTHPDGTERNIFSKAQQIPLKILEDYQNIMNYNFQEKVCIETRSLIHSVFSNMHIEYKDIEYIISYKVSTYKFTIFTEYDSRLLLARLNNVIEEDILIAQDGSNLIIQIVNKHPQILTLKELLTKQENLLENYLLPLGLTYENRLCELDLSGAGNLLVMGSDHSGVKNFIMYYIFGIFVKMNLINYEIELFDQKGDLSGYGVFAKIITEMDPNTYLNTVITEIDQKLDTINKSGTSSIDDYNRKLELDKSDALKLKRKFIIINRLSCDREMYSYFENKIMYVTQLGAKAGVIVLYVIREEGYFTSIVTSLFPNKLIFKLDSATFSAKVMNNENATFLQSFGDCFFITQAKARRLQTALVSKKDIESVNQYLK